MEFLKKFNHLFEQFQIVFLLCFCFFNCSKKDSNEITSIAVTQTKISINEGEDILIDLSLKNPLSADLHLAAHINIDTVSYYINANDYHQNFQFSLDGKKTWENSDNGEFTVKANTKMFHLKLTTLHDELLELDESFLIDILPVGAASTQLHAEIPSVYVSVLDDEKDATDELLGVLYEIDANGTYKVIAIRRGDLFLPPVLKSLIDNGPDERLKQQLNEIVKIGGVPIKRLDLFYDATSDIGGFVDNNSLHDDDWLMVLNMYGAYGKNLPDQINELSEIPYNDNGYFGFLVAHEYGHIATLNYATELSPIGEDLTCGPTDVELEAAICYKQDAILSRFNSEFYVGSKEYSEPHFVSDYASSNIHEDIAETFATFIFQYDIPQKKENSSGALHKIHFVIEDDQLFQYRDPIQNLFPKSVLPEEMRITSKKNRMINIDKKGHPLSCLKFKDWYRSKK